MTTSMAHPVLVVDDDEVMRDALVTLLSGEGYEVVTASNGREAHTVSPTSTLSPSCRSPSRMRCSHRCWSERADVNRVGRGSV